MKDGPIEHIDRETISRLLSLCNDPHGVATESFGDRMHELACLISSERSEQAVQPYTERDLRFLLHMGVLSASAHKGQVRQTGEDYWDTHLIGTDRNLIAELGRTRVALLGAGLGHDLKEDTDVHDRNAFRDAWRDTFINPSDELLNNSATVLERIWTLIESATKVKRGSREATSHATVRKLLDAVRKAGLDVIHLKAGGDRFDNMRTVAVKGEAARPIANETYEVFCRMGDIVGLRRYVRSCVDLCAGILNPELIGDFNAYRDNRIKEHFTMRRFLDGDRVFSVEAYVKNLLDPEGKPNPERNLLEQISTVSFDPARLADYVMDTDEPLSSLTISDLSIGSLSPMFETVILVKPGTDVRPLLSYLINECAEPSDRRSTENANRKGDLPKLGTQLTIHSRKLGLLVFRINNTVSEARSKRGALPLQSENPATLDEIPDGIRASVRRILSETQGKRETRTIPLTRRLLLRPNIIIYTPREDRKFLPRGSIAVDFAASVHPDLVAGFDRVICYTSPNRFHEIHPFDELKDGMQIEIIQGSGERFTPDPGWLLFCASEQARVALRKYLRKASTASIEEQGKAYIQKIADLFGFTVPQVLSILHKKRKSIENIVHRIGVGELEPLELLSGNFPETQGWHIRVELPDEPGILRQFLSEFDVAEINVNRFLHIPQPHPKPHVVRMEIEDRGGDKSAFEMMKILLKLSYTYSFSVSSQNIFKRSARRFGDFAMIIRNSIGNVLHH